MRILVTSGPTAVPIDGMRVLTNRSTGEMGRLIAGACAACGAHVTLIEGQSVISNLPLDPAVSLKQFFFYDELASLLDKELARGYDVVIHAAAVSDFQLARPLKGKISSGNPMTLCLVPTKKLVNRIKKTSPDVILIGFKFEVSIGRSFILQRVESLFKDARCDLVVANCFKAGRYEACLIEPSGMMTLRVSTKGKIVKQLAAWIKKKFL
ncbi:MAG: phosphopantothenoylcysteine decarboxylase [Candidatus Omnitrophota bacterium]